MTNSAKYTLVIIIERRKQKTSYRYSIIYLFFYTFVAYLSSYHEKAINALYELA